MSTVLSSKGHRYTQSATMPAAAASSQNPQNPHHTNIQAHTLNYDSSDTGYQMERLQPSTPPRTPRKFEQPSASQGKHNSNAPETNGSKQRSRNKNRPKNVMTSPAATRNDRITPPLTGQSAGIPTSSKLMSTPSGTAFAGATFHASPAPSALPIPSFYSKSVPDSPGLKGIKSLKDAAPSKVEASPTPPVPTASKLFQREESPLDIFFKADREEKARARSASSTQTVANVSGPFQPPLESPRDTHTSPAPNRLLESPSNRAFSSAIFAMELDEPSSPGAPFGPAFSTPYSERINAARLPRSITQPARIPQQQQPIDRSEALKAYLFSNQPLSTSQASSGRSAEASPLTPTSGPNRQNGTTNPSGSKSAGPYSRSQQAGYTHAFETSFTAPRTSGRSSGLRQEVTPSKTPTKTPEHNLNYPQSPTPSRTKGNFSSISNNFISSQKSLSPSSIQNPSSGISSGNRSADIQGMEESLRKILKLDSLGSSGIGGVNGVQSTGVPVPSVGGKPPHM